MNIYPLDLNFQGRPQTVAAYLVVGPAGPVLVETGPASTLETLKARLAEHGYTPADIRHVLVTHIHLDHAGAAGWWARQGAQVYVHHVGAPHLVDPSRLLASARRIYGGAMEALWGEILPAPAERVQALYDGDTLQVNGLTFTALDTPGHARHHHVFRLGRVAFAGDAAGVRLPGSDFISLPAPPPEFDLEAWQGTIARLLDQTLASPRPEARPEGSVEPNLTTLYPTHFGPIEDVREHLEALAALIHESAEFVRLCMQTGVERDALVKEYLAWNHERTRSDGLSENNFQGHETINPTIVSVDGLMRYWRKREGA